MQDNNIAIAAIAKVNEDKAARLVDEAQAKIVYIQIEQSKIVRYNKAIGETQIVLKGMEQEMLTGEQVLGRHPSLNPSPTEVTILDAIAKKNEEKAKSQASNSKNLVESIDGYLASIKACNARIDVLRKELAEMSNEVVTEIQILG